MERTRGGREKKRKRKSKREGGGVRKGRGEIEGGERRRRERG